MCSIAIEDTVYRIFLVCKLSADHFHCGHLLVFQEVRISQQTIRPKPKQYTHSFSASSIPVRKCCALPGAGPAQVPEAAGD